MRIALVAVPFVLAACQPDSHTDAATTVEPAASAEPAPDSRAMRFTALSDTAKAVTGDVAFQVGPRLNPDDPPAMRIKSNTGVTYDTMLRPGGPDEAAAIDWEYLFGLEVVTAANPPPGAPSVELHLVTQELVPPFAPNGGFCGAEYTHAIALATGLQLNGERRMSIAAFKGGEWPPKDASALCDVFGYTPPG